MTKNTSTTTTETTAKTTAASTKTAKTAKKTTLTVLGLQKKTDKKFAALEQKMDAGFERLTNAINALGGEIAEKAAAPEAAAAVEATPESEDFAKTLAKDAEARLKAAQQGLRTSKIMAKAIKLEDELNLIQDGENIKIQNRERAAAGLPELKTSVDVIDILDDAFASIKSLVISSPTDKIKNIDKKIKKAGDKNQSDVRKQQRILEDIELKAKRANEDALARKEILEKEDILYGV